MGAGAWPLRAWVRRSEALSPRAQLIPNRKFMTNILEAVLPRMHISEVALDEVNFSYLVAKNQLCLVPSSRSRTTAVTSNRGSSQSWLIKRRPVRPLPPTTSTCSREDTDCDEPMRCCAPHECWQCSCFSPGNLFFSLLYSLLLSIIIPLHTMVGMPYLGKGDSRFLPSYCKLA